MVRRRLSGTFEFHTSIDGDHVSLEAKFTDGTVVEIMRNASSLYG